MCKTSNTKICFIDKKYTELKTRGPKGHISCTWVQCATFLTDKPGQHFLLTHRPENRNFVKDVEILLPVKFHWIPFSSFREEVKKWLSQSEARVAILFFPISPKNTNLVEDVEILLPVKFRWIPFSGFREVKNVSVNQRPGRPSCFSDRPEKTQTW